ncbi:penicillin-binding protein 2 [Paralimibaculum aggregatum]|uniref:Penicillin-binding protein 2 n=1 Tax=Paralimibaculum aggregatum TaxID=3036245 RepID=A0ABQ6LG89_9RHOB|nr:penicillin-binding protein 2 [Limibaculum sp. NKW23]GMG82338.1 penicillin-binding protein 2 [Limibaculum sp. NKW23]
MIRPHEIDPQSFVDPELAPPPEPASTGEAAGELAPVRRDDWRLVLVMFVFLLAYGALAAKMAMAALGDPAEPSHAAGLHPETPVRGAITDRAGRLLAANLPAWALYADPREIRDPAAAADALAPIFPRLGRDELYRRLSAKRKFVWVHRPVTPRQKAAVMDLKPAIPGLKFGRRDMRVYPAGRMAAHLVGGTKYGSEGVNAAELIGTAGAEFHFDERLRDPALRDTPLPLSIDLGVQAALTEILQRGIEHTSAKGAAGILLDIRSSEILALVSLPDFNPNSEVRSVAGGEDNPRFNRAIKGVYELGSVFKPITAAIALDAGIAGPETMIETGTPVRFGRQRIRDMHAMPAAMTVTDIVRRSSNIGAARLARAVGTRRFRDYLDRLGMLEPLPLEIGEAASARPMLPPNWTELSTLTISFGHGLAVSPLHLTAAFATIANGGRLVVPTLMKGGRAPGEQVFSERTSAQMLDMLRAVVKRGTGRRTDVEGYAVGGKTGTADKARADGRGYHHDRVLASFASVFPVTNPRYAMLIMLDEPTDPESGKREASRTAVPVTAEAIRRLAPMLGLRPELPPVLPPQGTEARRALR